MGHVAQDADFFPTGGQKMKIGQIEHPKPPNLTMSDACHNQAIVIHL